MAIKISIGSSPSGRKGTAITALLHREMEPLFDAGAGPGGTEGLAEVFAKNPKEQVLSLVGSGEWALFQSSSQVKYLELSDTLKVLASRALGEARRLKVVVIRLPLQAAGEAELGAVLTGLLEASYEFTRYKSKGSEGGAIEVQVLVNREALAKAKALLVEASVINDAVTLARDLVNETPAAIYPEVLAQTARNIGKEAGLTIQVFDEKRLAKEQCNGVLTVGRGAAKQPRLMMLSYKPKGKATAHLVLVGKAVTFDTGGYSIKPAKSMWEMKGDMAGGAAVLAAMQAIARLKPGCAVTGIVPSAINAVGPDAVMPGEIIRSRSGKTVHVDNTDAEGRLLLMDALNIACELKPTHIVDIATLTGSIVRAIGTSMSGLFTRHDELAALIAESGEAVGERFWRMPMIEEYRAELSHPVADIDNVGRGANAGSITAALFLSEFVDESIPWAHLDIAGGGLITKKWKHLCAGGTGLGVKTFVELAKRL